MNGFFIARQFTLRFSLLLATIIAVVGYKLLEYVLADLPLVILITRRFIDPRAKFEGEWIFQLNNLPDRPYSVVSIQYIRSKRSYILSVYGGNPERGIRSRWENSTELMFNADRNKIMYCYQCQIIDKTAADVTFGYGVMSFDLNKRGSPVRRTGFFVDTGSHFFKWNYLIEKVTTG